MINLRLQKQIINPDVGVLPESRLQKLHLAENQDKMYMSASTQVIQDDPEINRLEKLSAGA